jgi:hypothetical protein
MTRRAAVIAIVLVGCAIFAAPVARQEVFTFRDHADYFQPLRWFTAAELRAGRLPLWNPYSASGEPWLANPQTGVFYPPTWLLLFLPFATAYMLFLLFHFVMLGLTSFLLFSRHAPPGAAALGAIALMVCGPTLSMLDVSNNLATFAWIPLVIWCALERRPILGGVALTLAFLGGEPFFAAIGALLFVILGRRSSLIAGATALGLSAVQLLPFLATLRGSDRAAGMGEVLRESMHPRDWLRIVMRPAINDYGFDAKLSQHYVPVIYIGVLVVLLALIGVVARRRDASAWLALLAFAILFAAGPRFLAALPMTPFRYPSRVVPFGALAICALAAAGWERMRNRRVWVDLAVIGVLIIETLPVSLPLLRSAPFPQVHVPYDASIGRDAKLLRVGAPRGAQWIAGYLNLYDRRFDAWTAAPVTSQRSTELYERAQSGARDALDALPVGYVFTAQSVNRLLALRNGAALPMARLHTRDGRIVPARIAVIDTSHATVVVDAPAPGTLVLTQQDAPGWSVSVDGNERPKRVAMNVFLAVDVEDGRHTVVWRYRAPLRVAGAFVTVITSALLIVLSRRNSS